MTLPSISAIGVGVSHGRKEPPSAWALPREVHALSIIEIVFLLLSVNREKCTI